MKTILLFIIIQTSCIMILTVPVLAYLDVMSWATPGILGIILIGIGAMCYTEWKE